MTREEAKRTLEFFSVCSENHMTIAVNSRDRQAIEMAIKALEQSKSQWMPVTKEQILQAGYEGREVRFSIAGRLFAIRELAQ